MSNAFTHKRIYEQRTMNSELKKNGFSLTEVLMAVGILAVGLIFIAGTFPVAIHLTTVATEQTIAAVVADEAFAKIKLYDVNLPLLPTTTACVDFNDVSGIVPLSIDPGEFAYPSTITNPADKKYYWSALCRRVDISNVQVTVFISRKIGVGGEYHNPRNPLDDSFVVAYPMPVPLDVAISPTGNPDELLVVDVVVGFDEAAFINNGYTIVDNATGRIYRVLKRYADDPVTAVNEEQIILLDRPWQGGNLVWVVPPPINGGRYPCIAVYQEVIRF